MVMLLRLHRHPAPRRGALRGLRGRHAVASASAAASASKSPSTAASLTASTSASASVTTTEGTSPAMAAISDSQRDFLSSARLSSRICVAVSLGVGECIAISIAFASVSASRPSRLNHLCFCFRDATAICRAAGLNRLADLRVCCLCVSCRSLRDPRQKRARNAVSHTVNNRLDCCSHHAIRTPLAGGAGDVIRSDTVNASLSRMAGSLRVGAGAVGESGGPAAAA